MDKYGQTVLLLVGQASVLILQQKYDEAEKLLQEAQQRDSNNAEALINLIIVSEQLGKGEEVGFSCSFLSHFGFRVRTNSRSAGSMRLDSLVPVLLCSRINFVSAKMSSSSVDLKKIMRPVFRYKNTFLKPRIANKLTRLACKQRAAHP